MLLPLATTVFWHPDPRNAESPFLIASSHVDLDPVDAAQAHADVLVHTGLPAAKKMKSHRLTYDAPLPEDPAEALRVVDGLYHNCTRCHLNSTRGRVVRWRGNPYSPVMFITDAPSMADDHLGVPLQGDFGKLHEEMCKTFGFPAEQAFYTSVVGCRPARASDGARPASTAELLSCSERLMLYLRAVRPRVVIALGKAACRVFYPAQETPPPWSWAQFQAPGDPDNAVMFGHAHAPSYLARVIGGAKTYREYAAARTYYGILASRLEGLTKVSRWPFVPRYLADFIRERQNDPPWDTGVCPDKVAHPVLRNLME